MITRLVLLGATGDLAGRFLLPALAGLLGDGTLPDDLRVVGAAQQDWDDETFREHVAERLRQYAPDVPQSAHRSLLAGLQYRRFDPQDPATVVHAVETVHGPDGPRAPVAVYLALPPRTFAPTLRALAQADLPEGSRIAVEKPFGEGLDDALALDDLLTRVTDARGVSAYRVDHILGMPRVQDVVALRSPGGPLEAAWDGAHLRQVDILWDETLGLAGRERFYDGVGAVKDVVQNHLLQVLALVAMEPPADGSEQALHDAKAQALRSVRTLTPDDVPARTRRARYGAGTLTAPDGTPGTAVGGYAQQDGVDPARGTETYGELLLEVDSPRWAGTTFVVRNGKALGTSRKGVALHFRGTAPQVDPADADRVSDTELWIELDGPQRSSAAPAVHVNAPGELSAYGRVLTDVLSGGTRTSVSSAESELAWRIVEPVLSVWAAGGVPLLEYAAGSAGPAQS
ncbi:glucose-6-phosphate dehydrogenase [Cellulomonas aerilata]|uniref:Glucose-6-phosphate 1-dehydrogenase n=1 Tax=Cellulomonas aerilata TaxID=515326 RepID=A0A512DH83_9CELL|nr:glucose-6-phosphate dehydrogenase [Cellulomonas aerilata]GEO35839.1 glucose-6-phosphate 1-dehydrogenase [Cellulomonas aerilata]